MLSPHPPLSPWYPVGVSDYITDHIYIYLCIYYILVSLQLQMGNFRSYCRTKHDKEYMIKIKNKPPWRVNYLPCCNLIFRISIFVTRLFEIKSYWSRGDIPVTTWRTRSLPIDGKIHSIYFFIFTVFINVIIKNIKVAIKTCKVVPTISQTFLRYL